MNATVCIKYLPSQIAAAALAITRVNCNLPICTEETEKITRYSMDDLKCAFLDVHEVFFTKSRIEFIAVLKKYNDAKYVVCLLSNLIINNYSILCNNNFYHHHRR